MTTVKELVSEVYTNLVYNLEEDKVYMKNPGNPQWVSDVIHACHYDGMLPDDFVYKQIYNLCYGILQMLPDEDPYDFNVEADCYTDDLIRWLSSNLTRVYFMDEAIETLCKNHHIVPTFDAVLSHAQLLEKQFILNTMLDFIERRLDDDYK